MTVWAGDDTDAAVTALEPFLSVGPVLQQQANLLPYSGLMQAHHSRHEGGAPANVRGGLVEHVTPRVAGVLADLLHAGESQMLQVRSVGGAVNAVPADATAYAHRTQNFSLSAITSSRGRAALDRRWEQLSQEITGVYRSFDLDDDRLALAYPPATLERLRAIAAIYDPDAVFGHDLPLTVPR
jgi:hypothetical protein